MDLKTLILLSSATGLVGLVCGYFLRWLISLGKKGSMELQIKQMILSAKENAQKIIEEADKKGKELFRKTEEEVKTKEEQFKKMEIRSIAKEDRLDKKQIDIEKTEDVLKEKISTVENIKNEAEEIKNKNQGELERISGMSGEKAKEELLKDVEKKYEEDILMRMQKLERNGEQRLDRKAKEILTSAIQRLANSTASETMSTTVSIPSDDIKGKIIGKEGRNIRAFEREAGVELVIDDTPGSVVISSFDPVRRQVARLALENLILDGRIQPAKIEEIVKKAHDEINKIIKEKGDQATYECGVFNLDQRIVSILGRLYFRTSYGQNVLQHSIEMAHIAGILAQELGLNVQVAKAGALLHDIGKAVDHEIQGTHVEIGRRILQKFGADENIIKAMQSHHEEYEYETPESIVVQVADAISGSRPGARRDSVENYLKRLSELEAIASSFKGVEKTYALQAGREIRVFVTADKVSDLEAKKLARDIATRIEKELKYPGEIKVNVIRELRSIEYAK